jgi:hypothetical protein
MAKGGFDTIIDNIRNRSEDDVVGVKKAKKTEQPKLKEQEVKKESGHSIGSMLDKIRDRDDDKIYNRGVYKSESVEGETPLTETPAPEKPEKKTGGLAIDSMLDRIRNRDDDDVVGLKSKKKL